MAWRLGVLPPGPTPTGVGPLFIWKAKSRAVLKAQVQSQNHLPDGMQMESAASRQGYRSPLRSHSLGSACRCCPPDNASGPRCFVVLSEPVLGRSGATFYIATQSGIARKDFDTLERAQSEFRVAEGILSLAARKLGHRFKTVTLQSPPQEIDREFEVRLAEFLGEPRKAGTGPLVCTSLTRP